MRRFPSMKVAFASILSCFALLLGLYATTGTASAHSAAHPFINVVSDLQRFGNCVSFRLEGGDFTPHHNVDLSAHASGGASIDPDRVRANGNGRFSVGVTACGNFRFENCGGFIENPGSFCGFNLPSRDFCGFNFEPNAFCFRGQFPGQFPGQFSGCRQFQCGFHRLSVSDFCRFHFHERFPFCFRFFPQEFPISIRVSATDEQTGHRAHAFVSIGGSF
jgi:hypothetical protein